MLAADAGVVPLSYLPQSCSTLVIGGDGVDDESASTIAELTQLTSLSWGRSPGLSDIGAQALTGLTGLADLAMWSLDAISPQLRAAVTGYPTGYFDLDLKTSEEKVRRCSVFGGVVAVVLLPAFCSRLLSAPCCVHAGLPFLLSAMHCVLPRCSCVLSD